MQLHTRIVQTACIVREKLTADLYEQLIRFHHIDLFDLFVMAELSCHAAVAAADHQYFLYIRMHRHRNMHDHLIIGKLVLLGKDHAAVRCKEASELDGIKYIDPLKVTRTGKQLFLYTNRHLHIVGMHFGKPEIQFIPPLIRQLLT